MDPDGASDERSAPCAVGVRVVGADDPVMQQVWDLCYETLHRPFGVARNDDWDDHDPSSVHIAAMCGEHLAGYARLIVSGDSGHIRQVGVYRAYRNRGVAAALMSEAIAIARQRGIHTVFLHARTRAIPMYQRFGFSVTGEPFRMGRTYLPHVRMERQLREGR